MKRITGIFVFGAGYAAFFLALAPAWLLSGPLAGRLAEAGGITLDDARGTVWHGSAEVRTERNSIERLEWSFRPQRLLIGEAAFALRASAPGLSASATLARGFGEWRVHDFSADVRADVAAQWLPLAGGFSPRGNVHAETAQLRYSGKLPEGRASVAWNEAAVALSDVHPLGNYVADIALKPERADFSVRTTSGVLRVAGQGSFEPPLKFSFNGEASAAPEMQPRLQALLQMLGTVNTSGVHVIKHGAR